jgi:murein DD-endopeptidase MepM/ murein hydrolase activator NlpD
MTVFGFHDGPGGNSTGIGKPDGYMPTLDQAGIPSFIKSADHYGVIFEQAEISSVSGNPFWGIFRIADGGDPDFNYDVPLYHLPPQEAAGIHWQKTLAHLPPEFDKNRVWLELINEPDKNRSDWLGWFGVECAILALRDGYKIAMFGFSTGEPDPDDWETPGMIEYLTLCSLHPDRLAVALHEYSLDRNDIQYGFPYLIGRFQFLFEVCDDQGIPRPNIFITEWGWEYQNVPDPVSAIADITWAHGVYSPFPEVKGMGIWYLGSGYGDIHNQTQRLIAPVTEFMVAHPPSLPPEPPVLPPNPGETLEEYLWRLSVERQVLSLYSEAAIQKRILETGFNPNENEEWEFFEGTEYAYQAGDHLGTGERRVFYSVVNEWDQVFDFGEPSPTPPIPPGNFSLTHWPAPGNYDFNDGNMFGDNPDDYIEFGLPGHDGVDIYADLGDIICAAAPGTVYRVHLLDRDGWHNYGNHVRIDHAEGYKTIYAHLEDIWADIAPGVHVIGGQTLGTGNSSGNSTGNHLHFGMKSPQGQPGWPYNLIDPEPFLIPLIIVQPPSGDQVDILPYIAGVPSGYGPLFELRMVGGPWDGSQERVQAQWHGSRFYITKGNEIAANWEERWLSNGLIYFGTDTSESNERYYSQRIGTNHGAPWVPQFMRIGESYLREPQVTHYQKSNCQAVSSDIVSSYIRLVAVHGEYSSPISGIVIPDVIELDWLWNPSGEWLEKYFYSRGMSLVGWKSNQGMFSHVSEIHPPGTRPNNTMASPSCLVNP